MYKHFIFKYRINVYSLRKYDIKHGAKINHKILINQFEINHSSSNQSKKLHVHSVPNTFTALKKKRRKKKLRKDLKQS